ncbi:MAG: 7-cyano-7-deazaguanine synthase QueC [Nitrososphaerota archaeon]|nr:7-cyano-7-deazaguanine synthase QueC [Nitrososphaerota archaeon]
MAESKSILLLSGGLDSTVALYWALDHGQAVETLSFEYFRRSKREIAACTKISKTADCPNRIIRLDFLKEIDDLKTQRKNHALDRAPSAYIPSRNIIFYGIAASIAEISDSRFIIGGHNKDDVKSFPDASTYFFKSLNQTMTKGRISGARTGRIILPLSKLSKREVIQLGIKLGVPFEDTWSCYKSDKEPCRSCPSCVLRANAFREARLPDPLLRRFD